MQLASLKPAPAGLAGEVARFLETCVHTLLCERQLYPNALFEPRRAYGIPAVASRHPMLNEYITALAESVQAWLTIGSMQRIVIAVLDPPRSDTNNEPVAKVLERFVFELCLMAPPPPPAGSSSAAASTSASSTAPLPAAVLTQLHTEFAAVLLKLAACEGHFTSKRPPGCTWSVLLYTNQATPPAAATTSHHARDMHAPELRWQQVSVAGVPTVDSSVTPFLDFPPSHNRIMSIRSIRTSQLHMEVYAEASDASNK